MARSLRGSGRSASGQSSHRGRVQGNNVSARECLLAPREPMKVALLEIGRRHREPRRPDRHGHLARHPVGEEGTGDRDHRPHNDEDDGAGISVRLVGPG